MQYYGQTKKAKVSFSRAIIRPKTNNQITAPELRVIGVEGENLGVLSLEQALALVRPGEGVDLIEIAPGAKPPVARLMSFDKYRYLQEKLEKKARRAQKTVGIKQIQISARAAQNDLMIKVRQLEKFLGEGHRVEIMLRLRGRERFDKGRAHQKLKEFLKMITTEYKMLAEPKFGGRGMMTHIAKK